MSYKLKQKVSEVTKMSRTIYKCAECKARFDEPIVNTWKEKHEFWGAICYEDFSEAICPECGSEDFDEIWEDAYDEDIDGPDEPVDEEG
jgi:DNA-directed RNA polymerase subunit RPC12/RpoP